MDFWKLALLLYLSSVILLCLQKDKSSRVLFLLALVSHAAGLIFWTRQVAHLPIFTEFETFSSLGFVIGLLVLFCYWYNQFSVQLWARLIIIGLLSAALLWPPTPPCFDYNHGYTYAILFHLFRRLALSLALFASAIFLSALLHRENAPAAAALRHQGRNALMAAVLIYFLSEDVGIIWCLKGWADIWRWSPGFMISSMVLIYLMLALHLPGGSRKAGLWYTLVGISCGPLMLLAQLYKA
jgi:hypothetical protein